MLILDRILIIKNDRVDAKTCSRTLDKMQRIYIGLNSVTSFVWSTSGTGHTPAIFHFDGKTLLSMRVLII